MQLEKSGKDIKRDEKRSVANKLVTEEIMKIENQRPHHEVQRRDRAPTSLINIVKQNLDMGIVGKSPLVGI